MNADIILVKEFAFYWGGAFKGRGEYVRLMFELAAVPYEETNDVQQLLSHIDRGATSGDAPYPAFTVPLIITPEGDSLSQTPAIMAFLGKRFGYYPENEMDEFHGLQIVNTVADFHAEGRACFHPVDIMASFHTQEKEAEVSAKKFASSRLIAWLKHLNHLLESNPNKSGFFIGTKLTYVDVSAFYVLLATKTQFPEAWNSLTDTPAIKEFLTAVGRTPAIENYLKSDRAKPFSGNSMM